MVCDAVAHSPTNPVAAYQEQQLLEEEEDDLADGANPTVKQLPPDSILDSSNEELPAAPTVPAQGPVTRQRLAAAVAASTTKANTTYSVPTGCPAPKAGLLSAIEVNTINSVPSDSPGLSGSSTVTNTTYSVSPPPSNEPPPLTPSGNCEPTGNSVSAMEGVASASYSGSPPQEYFAIKNNLRIKYSFSDLVDGEKSTLVNPGNCGSFFTPGDTREYLCKIYIDIKAGTVTSASFDPSTM